MRRSRNLKVPTKEPKNSFPQGTFIKTETGYYYIGSTSKFKIITKRVLDSWSPSRVVAASDMQDSVLHLRLAGNMKFRNGSLLYSQATGKMYLVSDNQLRHITDPDWLDALGFKRSEAVWVSSEEINLHEMGEPLN